MSKWQVDDLIVEIKAHKSEIKFMKAVIQKWVDVMPLDMMNDFHPILYTPDESELESDGSRSIDRVKTEEGWE